MLFSLVLSCDIPFEDFYTMLITGHESVVNCLHVPLYGSIQAIDLITVEVKPRRRKTIMAVRINGVTATELPTGLPN